MRKPEFFFFFFINAIFFQFGYCSLVQMSHSREIINKISRLHESINTAQKMKFSIKDFFIKCEQIRCKQPIWSHLLKKSLMENFILCAVCAFSEIAEIAVFCFLFHYTFQIEHLCPTIYLT